jgi:hypothetical protein
VKGSSLVSKPGCFICPLCEAGQLRLSGHDSAWCRSCLGLVSGATLGTLRQITALPDALGSHACECGHPEMRLLPDGTYYCPACGSEVLSLKASGEPRSEYRGEAYRCGWIDGHFGEIGCFTENQNLSQWQGASDRLDYYRGHRAGSEVRQTARSSRIPRACEGLHR